jgi:hypothetical protein
MNQLTLDLAATSFFGADIGPEVEDINRAFVDMVAVAITPTRRPCRAGRWRASSMDASVSSPISGSRFRCTAPRGRRGELATHPDWQSRMRDEVTALKLSADAPTRFDDLEDAVVRDGVQGGAADQASGAVDAAPARCASSRSRAL